MDQKKKYIIMALIAVLIIGAGYGLYRFRAAYTEDKKISSDSDVKSLYGAEDLDSFGETYVHPEYNFTFKYPSHLQKTDFEEGEGEIILFRSENSNEGFQIFISSYEEAEDLSVELVKKSAAQVIITNGKKTEIGPDKIGAIEFDAEQSPGNKTHEVWFVLSGTFYQITSYQEYEDALGEILKTWRFI